MNLACGRLGGDRHRHGAVIHSHPHRGPHGHRRHDHDRLFDPREPTDLLALAAAGLIGSAGNWTAAIVRTRAGKALGSPALIADGSHARADSYVSLAVVASAVAVALGAPIVDPLIGLGIAAALVKIAWDSWWTVRDGRGHRH